MEGSATSALTASKCEVFYPYRSNAHQKSHEKLTEKGGVNAKNSRFFLRVALKEALKTSLRKLIQTDNFLTNRRERYWTPTLKEMYV